MLREESLKQLLQRTHPPGSRWPSAPAWSWIFPGTQPHVLPWLRLRHVAGDVGPWRLMLVLALQE
eukprot:1353125-Lingulodinium_polyedra.AAC.1